MSKNDEKQLSIMDAGEREFFTVTDRTIEFIPSTPREVWLGAVQQLTHIYESSKSVHCRAMFMLGDALNFGESAFGEEFAQAIEDTRVHMGVSNKTILNVAAICKKIAPDIRRVDTVTLAIHDAVARLQPAEQDELLKKAENDKWTLKDAKAEIIKRHPKGKGGKERQPRAAKAAVIDLTSEDGLAHAAEKIAEWFTEHAKPLTRAETGKPAAQRPLALKDWPQDRKRKWAALKELATVARRMGLVK